MSDGWLFRLRSNLGSRYVAPTWPSADPRSQAQDAPADAADGADPDANDSPSAAETRDSR